MDIIFFAGFEDENDDLTIKMNENIKVRDMIPQVLKQFGLEYSGNIEKYCFMYGQKYISSKDYLDKTLKQIGLKTNRRLKIMRLDALIPA